jgi:hypothetical protein
MKSELIVLSKPMIKKKSKQEVREPEILIDVDSESLDGKNKNDPIFQKTVLTKPAIPHSPLLMSGNSKYVPVEKSLVEEAFIDLKKTINQDFLFHLNLKILLQVFEGLIAKQLLEKFFNQQSLKKPSVDVDQDGYSQFGLKFDSLLVEDKKHIVLDLKAQPPKDRVFIIRKTKWDYLKRECKKNTGRLPDYLFFILIFKNTLDDLCRTFESRNLEENLSILEKWVLSYSGNYSAEIVGWINGVDVEKLNDSSRIPPQGVALRKPAFWCYVSDPYLKPISDFCLC